MCSIPTEVTWAFCYREANVIAWQRCRHVVARKPAGVGSVACAIACMPEPLSAFVITYNRAALLETCLRAVAFADELIVVDKSSTDGSAAIASHYADRVEIVPWSPTVEATRAFAVSLCRHQWILCLDDDEILSPATGPWLGDNLGRPDVDVFAVPLRHYILGVHDERAYYWPEQHYRVFRKGAIEFVPVVHGGLALQSNRIVSIPADSGVCIHHLSYQDVASWIERTNRYTSQPDRVQPGAGTGNLVRFAHEQIDYWMGRSDDPSGNDYPAAVALLRAIYDMIDRLKAWETARAVDGAALFRRAQQTLVPAINACNVRPRPVAADPDLGELDQPSLDADTGLQLQEARVELRATEARLRVQITAERKLAEQFASTCSELHATIAALAETRQELATNRTMLQQTSATLEQTSATLDQTRNQLDQTRTELGRTMADLANARQGFEQLSNSGRVFMRQYLPKLWRHLARTFL